ncbi:MAG: metallophosphoesterase [Bacteroidetes bacterium]|nr:metallophosphoesterase [Bacteroidota bacterium]
MKKALSLALFFSGVVALILILLSFFPKYQGVLIFLTVFLLGDLVLWFSVRTWISRRKPIIRSLLTILYWLPATSLACLVIYGFFRPFITWNVTIMAVLLSLLMMTIVAKMIPLLISLLSRLIGLISYNLLKIRIVWLKWIELSAWIIGGLFWLTLGLGMIIWVYDFKVTTVDFPSARIPASFNNFRIVQFSDVHLGNWTCREKLLEAVNKINDLKPDLIVFTGDMFTFSTAEGKGFIQYLKQLHARCGIVAIMGNHDYGDYVRWENTLVKKLNLEDLYSFYTDLGWNLLLNRSVAIRSGSDSINIIGVQNWGATKRFQRYGDIDKAETGINRSCFCLLLSHDPSYWDSIICRQHPEIDLTLSGHTHGGQFGIETGSLRWSILSWSNSLWGGYYIKNKAGFNSRLYVNRGLGTVGYAGRVGIKPEITLIILHSIRR